MIRRILSAINSQVQADSDAKLMRRLMLREAKIGGRLFGEVPAGHTREFFCLDENTWVWHEEWQENGQTRIMTTRYDIRPDGVLKSQNGHGYKPVSFDEARRLVQAAKLYLKAVNDEIYSSF